MKTESIAEWQERTKKTPKVGPTKKAKGLELKPSGGNSHMGTKSQTHAWWDEAEEKPTVVLRKSEAACG